MEDRRHGRGLPAVLLLATALAAAAAGCRARPGPAPDPALRAFEVREPATGERAGRLWYWSNLDPAGPVGRTRAVIVVHGDERNADDYFRFALEAAGLEGASPLIVAPRFPTERDRPAPDDLRWTDDAWKGGEAARGPTGPGPGSFEAIAQLLRWIAERDPAIEEVVIAGHSAGGQFAQRYAAAGRLPAGPRYRFVVANPSSYLYLDDRRPDGGEFNEPSRAERRACAEFDAYRYGLDGLPREFGEIGATTLREQYRRRDVTQLVGARDRERDGNLDRSCAADLQGETRLERGVRFYQYLTRHFPPTGRHRLEVVAGVAHDARGMLTSEAGRAALFRGPGGMP